MAEGEHFYRLLAFHCYPGNIQGKSSQCRGPEAGRSKVCQAGANGMCVRGRGETGKAWSARKRWFYFTSNREQLLEGSKEACDKI